MAGAPLVEILVTKLDAEVLYEALPASDERRKLWEKIRACEVALQFLRNEVKASGVFCRKVEMRAKSSEGALP
jgi:hypothetical protein